MAHRATVLIMARSRQVRDGLHALLHAIPGVDIVDASCECLRDANLITEVLPDLILADCNCWRAEVQDVLRTFKMTYPDVNFLILVDDVKHREHLQDMGMEHVLIKGTPAAKLAKAIREILSVCLG